MNPEPTQLLITLSPDGAIQVQGPIHNKILCYGMLEAARDALQEYDPKKAAPQIIPVKGPFPPNGHPV